LSVSTPVQEALPTLLVEGAAIRSQIRDRVTRNYRSLMTLAAAYPSVGVLASEGGWCAVMQVPAMQSEESLALRILEHDHVLVYPGFFFDFPREAFLIVSLLPAPDAFDGGIAKVLARVESGP
jgi:alanine-synthesizing transaminase